MLDENKSDIYDLLPDRFVPNTIRVSGKDNISMEQIEIVGLTFPLIVKPNIGFRGYKVVKVFNLQELNSFISAQSERREWLIQEFLDYEKEYSLLFYRIPGSGRRGITSLVEKIYPFIVGDGERTLEELIDVYENPFIDRDLVIRRFQEKLKKVLAANEKLVLDEIGNYARGSKFLDIRNQIDLEMEEVMRDYFKEVNGLDFFRMDFKSDNLDAFKQGEFKILEINGAKSEPIHIYDPKNKFLSNVKTIVQHWVTIKNVVKERKKQGNYRFPTTRYGLKSLIAIKKLVK
jgi:hypothetical protein